MAPRLDNLGVGRIMRDRRTGAIVVDTDTIRRGGFAGEDFGDDEDDWEDDDTTEEDFGDDDFGDDLEGDFEGDDDLGEDDVGEGVVGHQVQGDVGQHPGQEPSRA